MADEAHDGGCGHVFTATLRQHVLVPEDQLVEAFLDGIRGNLVAGDLHRRPVQQYPIQLHVGNLRRCQLQGRFEVALGDVSLEGRADKDAFLGHAPAS